MALELRLGLVEGAQRAHMDRLDALEERMDALDKRLESMHYKLDNILETLNIARGGLRMLVAVGAVAATGGALIGHLWNFIQGFRS